jgi:hypothetical protein
MGAPTSLLNFFQRSLGRAIRRIPKLAPFCPLRPGAAAAKVAWVYLPL